MAGDFKVTLSGDWLKARRIVRKASEHGLERAIGQALQQEAWFMAGRLKRGIIDQAPGGQRFSPLAKTTLARRRARGFRGRKALIHTSSLLNSITVKSDKDEAFVGILRTARGAGGKSMVNIAQVQEEGAGPYLIKMTPKMRAFLFSQVFPRVRGKRPHVAPTGFIVVKIPARPFFRPTWEQYGGEASGRRMLRRIVVNLKAQQIDLGTV